MTRISTERLVASVIWSREDPRYSGHDQHGQPISFSIYYKCGIIQILNGLSVD